MSTLYTSLILHSLTRRRLPEEACSKTEGKIRRKDWVVELESSSGEWRIGERSDRDSPAYIL